ncbi:hypothetical protein GALMADRAFT_107659, partial [Galerina marginata CBS 339.88]
MASRRLDISSLLCDDNPPAFSPLEALVHAATEERKRLDATHDQPRIHYDEQPHHRPHHDHLEQHHAQHRAQELELRGYDIDRRRRQQESELQQQQQQQQQLRLQEQKRAQDLEYQAAQYQRQKDIDRVLRAQEHERRVRDEEERRIRELYERQQREERHREAERQRIYEQRLLEDRILEQRQREEREFEHIRQLERDRLIRENAERQQRELIERQREQDRLGELHRQHRPQPIVTTPHPPSISHLISHPHHRKSDSIHTPPLHALPGPILPPSHDDPRPIKKRRYSESPTRPIPDDKERIARERDKMLVGELGYGRVDSPTAGPSYPPRRPGSGHGHARKPVAVSDLLIDGVPVRPVSREADAHRVVSPPGRRSPPGSQIGRAKAARKSDEYLMREPPPTPVEPEPKKLKDEPKIKQEPKPTRPRSDEIRTPIVEEPRIKKPTAPPPPPLPPAPPKILPTKVQQEDAHEWFLQQFDAEPSPTTSARPEPPHSPSPSLSPVASIAPAPPPPSAKTPPASHKSLTPIAAAVATLEEELEELVSEPATTAPASATVVKKQDPDLDMDLDVDLAVTELVDTLDGEGVKHEPAGMEVDVEDELLSLVDDRPPAPVHPPAAARRVPGSSSASTSHGSATPLSSATTSAKPAPPIHRSVSEARQASPPLIPASVASAVSSSSAVRQSSTRPTSERGSMPPPASTSTAAKKGVERASSVVPSAAGPSGKKKKETTAKTTSSKAKPAAAAGGSSTPAAPTAKPRAKPAAKSKKGVAPEAAAPAPPAPSKAAKALTGRKTAPSVSRSRSASVMPAGSASVGPESDAVKAEKQEEEEESDAENEDDKLYCVCKTKYDEDRFMIACDRCDEWYHTQCVRMPDLEVDLVDQFICPLCVEKNPHLDLQTTYKQRCLYGLRHPDPSSTKACHKAARGAFSKYCSDECGVKYMQSRIDTWAKKGGKPDKLWESVKNAEKREGVVVCAVEPEINGCKMEVDMDTKPELDVKPELVKQRIVPPKKRKVAQETERLNALLDSVVMLREEIKRGMEVVVWRERLLQLASERAESVGQCGWDQRLCLDDEEWADSGAGVLESYEDAKPDGAKENTDGEMEVDGTEEQWWCPGKKVCGRHAGWQTVRYKDVCKEKEKKEEALAKLTTREREIRKRIEDMLEPQNGTNLTSSPTTKAVIVKETTSNAPLKASNAK